MVLDTGKSSFRSRRGLKFHIWFFDYLVLLVTKFNKYHFRMRELSYYRIWQVLLQNTRAILLQNSTKIYYKMRQFSTTKNSYHKTRRFYYKIWQLLQNASVQPDIPISPIQFKYWRLCLISYFCLPDFHDRMIKY